MSSIVTFYSYKGGVGRSMALANIAVLLARGGFRVLAIDWDLEAPGLDQYFNYFAIDMQGGGLLRMLIDFAASSQADYRNYTWQVHSETKNPITLLTSGRGQDVNYSLNLEHFNWKEFFQRNKGGHFIEALRTRWRKDFDFILVDSRTGLSDAGGICSIQLPDVVVAMFTPNHQSLYGVRDVMRLAQQARQALAYDRMPLTVLPLPSRFGTTSEFRETQEWLKRSEEALQEFFSDWLPRSVRPRQILERIKIPQVDYFGFGEKLAVIDQGTGDPGGMGYSYQKVAGLLASDFSDIKTLLGSAASTEAQDQVSHYDRNAAVRTKDEYQFDLYVSYDHRSEIFEWLRRFTSILSLQYERISGVPLEIFLDLQQVSLGEVFSDQIANTLRRSKLLLLVASPSYFNNSYCLAELLTFREREKKAGFRTLDEPRGLIVPALIRGGEYFPDWLQNIQFIDFTEAAMVRDPLDSPSYLMLDKRVTELAETIFSMLERVPAFREWPVVSPRDAQKEFKKTPRINK